MMSYPASKWIFDKVLCLVALVLLAPVFAFVFATMAVAMLLRPADRGPLLYRERRITRGRQFDLLKFRTLRRAVLEGMSSDSHARIHEMDAGNLTWSGRRILKRWYLDELPQLWNVLRGDMSVVGPRPWPPLMVASQVERGLTYRNEVVAGWTGPAQVRKGITAPEGYVELDLAYVEACRTYPGVALIRTDLGILRRTVAVMMRGEGLRY